MGRGNRGDQVYYCICRRNLKEPHDIVQVVGRSINDVQRELRKAGWKVSRTYTRRGLERAKARGREDLMEYTPLPLDCWFLIRDYKFANYTARRM